MKRNMLLLAMVAAAVTLACGGDDGGGGDGGMALAFPVPAGEAPEEPQLPQGELRVEHPDAERSFDGGFWSSVAWSPDGSTLAAAAIDLPDDGDLSSADGVTGSLTIYQPAADEAIEVDIPGGPDDFGAGLSWSPDGEVLAVTGGDGVTLMSASGDEAGFVDDAEARPLPGFLRGSGEAWSPDGSHLAIALQGALLVVDRDGQVIAETPPDEFDAQVEDTLNDGETLVETPYLAGRWMDDTTLAIAMPVRVGGGSESRTPAVVGELDDGSFAWDVRDEYDAGEGAGGPSPQPEWAELGRDERFDNGIVLGSRQADGIDAGWIAYEPSGGQAVADVLGATVAFVVHDGDQLDVLEDGIDGGWFGGMQNGLPFDVARIE